MAHANLVADDAEHTGFDWEGGITFGAKTIGEVFALLSNLQFERELRTQLYRVQLFPKRAGSSNSPPHATLGGNKCFLPFKVQGGQ